MVLVGNKCDLPTRSIDMQQAKDVARYQINFISWTNRERKIEICFFYSKPFKGCYSIFGY